MRIVTEKDKTMTIGMIACSTKAYELMQELKLKVYDAQPDVTIFDKVKCSGLPDLSMGQSLSECVGEWWNLVDAIVFVCATGIAVRSIASHIGHKSTDPAVLVIDETGYFCIPLLSGHMGGGNELATQLSDFLKAVPVITTATDREGKFAVDDFARKNRMIIRDWQKAKEISVRILNGQTVIMTTDLTTLNVQGNLPKGVVWQQAGEEVRRMQEDHERSLTDKLEKRKRQGEDDLAEPDKKRKQLNFRSTILISYRDYNNRKQKKHDASETETLQLIPRIITVGIGCRKDTPTEKIEHAIRQCLSEEMILPEAICTIASIDLKKQEPGLVSYCEQHSIPFVTFSSQQLGQVKGEFSESDFVSKVTGVSNVCERSAVLASGGILLCHKKVFDGVTIALAQKKERVIF